MNDMLKTLPYWEFLTEEEKKRVETEAYVRHYEQGEVLYGPTVECVGMIHVLRGETRAYILSDEGREVTLFHVVEADNCILSASCVLAYIRFESFMVAVEPSDILIVPVELFGRLCDENVHVRCFAYELATTRFSMVMTSIRITQEQLALEVNSARETVGRLLKKFEDEGMIENHRGSILLTDVGKLEKAAS